MFATIKVESWDDAKELRKNLAAWRFRGHADANWRLATRLERDTDLYKVSKDKITNRERWILNEFKKRTHHYVDNPPANDQIMEWIALLQHYGGSTRLLDFTKSFYVASFFAMENAMQDAAVWGIDYATLITILINKTKGSGKEFIDQSLRRFTNVAELWYNEDRIENLVLPVELDRMNERISIQQGSFLFPCNPTATFEYNLAETLDLKSEIFDTKDILNSKELSYRDIKKLVLMKIILPRGIFSDALWDLQEMNINSATLFPGLEGFARSLTLYHRMRL